MLVKTDIQDKIVSAPDVTKVARALLALEHEFDQDKEHFWTIGLTGAHTVKYVDLVSLGILDQTCVHAREVFRQAVLSGASAVVFCHNHPSGQPTPSPEDQVVTDKLKAAGRILGIEVLDHVIVTRDGFYSFAESGQL